MSAAWFASLVLLPTVIDAPGKYRTRDGNTVEVQRVSQRHDFGCVGTYSDGVRERWHRSGRIFFTQTSSNDVIARLGET